MLKGIALRIRNRTQIHIACSSPRLHMSGFVRSRSPAPPWLTASAFGQSHARQDTQAADSLARDTVCPWISASRMARHFAGCSPIPTHSPAAWDIAATARCPAAPHLAKTPRLLSRRSRSMRLVPSMCLLPAATSAPNPSDSPGISARAPYPRDR